jgi:hypothetical protein
MSSLERTGDYMVACVDCGIRFHPLTKGWMRCCEQDCMKSVCKDCKVTDQNDEWFCKECE